VYQSYKREAKKADTRRLQLHSTIQRQAANNTPSTHLMINDSPCSTSYHEWREKEHMASGLRHEPSKTILISLIILQLNEE
jgi:hypothetical protein